MLYLDTSRLFKSSLCALTIILGVVGQNALEQAKMNTSVTTIISSVLFVGGWLILPFFLSRGRNHKYLYFIFSYMILMAAVTLKAYMTNNNKPPMLFGILFMLGWVFLGVFVASPLKKNNPLSNLINTRTIWGLIAAACAILSMKIALPFERKNCIADGPGMSLFTIAWVLVSLLDSFT